jgi:ATP/maltotriose-dependent transcriptional regulator MalT/DNA-binding SARP family transcriptional activator
LLGALEYRLTLLITGAGYGKSTALALLAEEFQPLIWYQAGEEDNDPLVFLLHLCHATRLTLPQLIELPIAYLEGLDGTEGNLPWQRVIDQYINALSENLDRPTLLVLDDPPLTDDQEDLSTEIAYILDRLVGLAPPNLHILIAGRSSLDLPNLPRWRAQGDVLTIDQSFLAFTAGEIASLFTQHYGYELTSDEVDTLLAYTEGWAIALQLIWQNMCSNTNPSLNPGLNGEELKRRSSEVYSSAPISGSPNALFDVLAREVFERQPPDVQEFLKISASLRTMTPGACDAVRGRSKPMVVGQTSEILKFHVGYKMPDLDSAAMLGYLRRQELFVVEQADGSLRFHRIFHDFLRQQSKPEQRQVWHERAAQYFRSLQDVESTIYHLLQGQAWDEAAVELERYGEQLIASGRLDTLKSYLDILPPEVLHQHPLLLFYLGDLARLGSHFQEALGWYQQAEVIWRTRGQPDGIGRALRGLARVYLDTVDPSQAEKLLEQAIRLSDGTEDRDNRARLYELLAENKLNAGHVEDAEQLRQQAVQLRTEGPSDQPLLFRVLLRTGRLEEARQGLEARIRVERISPVQTPRAHRETLLLLSLVDAFQGRAEQAYSNALEGTQRGMQLNSAFITAVGYMRQGHALMLLERGLAPWLESRVERYELARQQFEHSLEISRSLTVRRLTVEANWGLCRVYGFQGDLIQAMKVAEEGIDIAIQAGDEWVAALVQLAMGASLVLANRYEPAEDWLSKAARSFHACSDPFGRTAARLWISLALFQQKDWLRLSQILPEVLASCRAGGYDFLFTRTSLLGSPDIHSLIPLLILARDRDWECAYAIRLLENIGLAEINLHPGYQLRILTLGAFSLYRGIDLIPVDGWRREKARQLFQIFITYRGKPLDRDQICEILWPSLDPHSAQRNFRIVLNALYHVLEPGREPGSESAYIMRDGTSYVLRPHADLWLDADLFQSLIRQADLLAGSTQDQSDCGELDTRLEAIAKYEQAIRLYQGEYLQEIRYESWAAMERERLAVLFLQAADRLSELYLSAGRFEELIRVSQRILTQDNCWERTYRRLMLAYERLGDHGQIGRVYQRCVQVLREELDVSPAPETELLYANLVRTPI